MKNPFTVRCDWPAILRPSRYNWIDFDLIHASGEYDPKFGNLELHVALLGFHLYARWKVSEGDKEFLRRLEEMTAEFEENTLTLAQYKAFKEGRDTTDYLNDFGPNVPVEDLGGKPAYPGREKAP